MDAPLQLVLLRLCLRLNPTYIQELPWSAKDSASQQNTKLKAALLPSPPEELHPGCKLQKEYTDRIQASGLLDWSDLTKIKDIRIAIDDVNQYNKDRWCR